MARYPDSIVGSLTPSEYYDKKDAGEEYTNSICSAIRPGALRVIEQVRDLAGEIRSRRHISTIILHGSFARGDFHEGSDASFIIVGDLRERPHRQAATILGLTELPIEPICYTDKEFTELIQSENPFILQALAEGIRV